VATATSTPTSTSTPSNTTPPTEPQNLTAATANGRGVNLSWSAPASGSPITGYNVYRGTASGTETLLASLGNQLSYEDTATTRGATYYYKVKAVNSAGVGPYSGEVSMPAK